MDRMEKSLRLEANFKRNNKIYELCQNQMKIYQAMLDVMVNLYKM